MVTVRPTAPRLKILTKERLPFETPVALLRTDFPCDKRQPR